MSSCFFRSTAKNSRFCDKNFWVKNKRLGDWPGPASTNQRPGFRPRSVIWVALPWGLASAKSGSAAIITICNFYSKPRYVFNVLCCASDQPPFERSEGDSQNRKFVPIFIITEAKKAYIFLCKRTESVNQMFGDFVKMTLTPVSSHWMQLEWSHLVKRWLESSPSHKMSWLESIHWLESRYHWWKG